MTDPTCNLYSNNAAKMYVYWKLFVRELHNFIKCISHTLMSDTIQRGRTLCVSNLAETFKYSRRVLENAMAYQDSIIGHERPFIGFHICSFNRQPILREATSPTEWSWNRRSGQTKEPLEILHIPLRPVSALHSKIKACMCLC